MKLSELADISHLHHAYIVAGSSEGGSGEVLAMLEKRGVKTIGDPDLLSLSFPELLVDNVRDSILPFASLKPLGKEKYLIISFVRANEASQNALLKAVEESLGHTIFFFCVDSAGHVLPTVRSRCILVEGEGKRAEEGNEDAKEFLKESYEKRLARVEKMAGYISKTQDRAPARGFVAALMREAHEGGAGPSALRDLLDADRYLRLQGSSAKSVLGHLAVSLPRSVKSPGS